MTPAHLGGHNDKTNLDRGALDYLIAELAPKTFLDIGCGPGGMVRLAKERCLDAVGVDGDASLQSAEWFILHDYTLGPLMPGQFDLGWCIEFVEHVEEQYLPNYMATFESCKYLVLSHALPGTTGHHHVNVRPPSYWIQQMTSRGWMLDDRTSAMRIASTMKPPFLFWSGLLWRKP